MRYNKRRQKAISSQVTVRADECGGNAEKMVRRFIKKVKKEGIVEEFRRRSHFIKPTTLRAERKAARKRVIQKVNNKRDALINMKDRSVPKRRK